MNTSHKIILALALLTALACCSPTQAAQRFLVEQGQPKAEIVIAANPTRTQLLAAVELQTYIAKISGAKLEIHKQLGDAPLKLYVGESRHTRQLGVTAAGLKHGAYRIVSGEDWMAFMGDNSNFTPIEPWPRSYSDIRSGKMQAAWDKITGEQWGYMHSQLHKHYSGRNSQFGTPDEKPIDDNGNVHVWTYDERGSFNAVCAFLRGLGVRWYMPGEIGEIVPRQATIALPKIDQTVRPDFPMRVLNFRTAVYGRDVMMWGFRLGVRQPYGRQAAHGLHGMTDNERTLKNHPDWFALYGGKRHNQANVKNNQLCYSNEQLFRESVRFAQAQFDHFDMDVVSIMPPDGYTSICQCELCEGKDSPELGARGALSNYVWDFVNRVAKEIGKSHPGKKISNCAYGVYTEPPSNIKKLEPNVQVIIVGGRRPLASDRDDLRRLRAAWSKKTDNPIEIFENYPFTGRGFYLPAYFPSLLGESINATKGQSRGEDIWITMDFSEKAVGYNHFLLYFTARMYWGGKQQDASALFDEYVEKFYGPAAPEMAKFFQYCEQHWRKMEKDASASETALRLFAAAKAKLTNDDQAHQANSTTSPTNVYARRLALIDNYLNGLRAKARQLAQKRGLVPKLRLVSGATQRGEITIDGKLNDGPWLNIPVASSGQLRELQTGRLPTYGTRFMAEWIGNDLYLAIRCDEKVRNTADLPPSAKYKGEPSPLNIATRKDGDQAIWYGDAIEILLSTDSHSYYQIAVNPAGAVVDLDRGASRNQWFNWSSKAEVATRIEDDFWTVEMRIPITTDANDPLHQVVGRKPTQSLPWHINVCRQRIRDNAAEYSAFSPTGAAGFHKPMKFAHFYAGRSHAFPADASVSDFLLASVKADAHYRKRRWSDALKAYLSIADQKEASELQKSVALQRAVRCALQQNDFDQANEVADQIPLPSVADTTRMQILSSQRKWNEVLDRFGQQDLTRWPFWQIGEAAFVRGRAYLVAKQGEQADADLRLALHHSPDLRTQLSIMTLLAQNREVHLRDPAGALPLYLRNFQGKTGIGGADEFRSLQRASAILANQGKLEESLALFEAVDFDKTKGFWLQEMLLAKGRTLLTAGRKDQALDAFRRVLAAKSASSGQKKAAQQALQKAADG